MGNPKGRRSESEAILMNKVRFPKITALDTVGDAPKRREMGDSL